MEKTKLVVYQMETVMERIILFGVADREHFKRIGKLVLLSSGEIEITVWDFSKTSTVGTSPMLIFLYYRYILN